MCELLNINSWAEIKNNWMNNSGNFKMLQPFYFALGLINNLVLIFIFLIHQNHSDLLQRNGWIYFLLAVPAIYAIFLVQKEH